MDPNSPLSQPTDPQALALTHAIALQESGSGGAPNYNAVGDNGTSHGAYQWQPGNFAAAATKAGLDPNDFSPANQDKVAYSEVKAYKDQGYSPGQIASLWNSGSPDNWQNHSGTATINGKPVAYDTPAYVKGVQAHYQSLLSSTGAGSGSPTTTTPPATNTAYNPKPFSNPLPGAFDFSGATGSSAATTPAPTGDQGTLQGLSEDLTGTNPQGIGTQIGNAAKKLTNFLFPAVGDVYHDIKGDNTKTALQQAGDVGLSALPFIPGLGEVGEGARAGIGAAELGAGVAGEAGAKAGSGLVGSLLKNGAVGYGSGVASNLSQGQSIGQAVSPNLTNLVGAGLGVATPLALRGASGFINKIAGISPQMENDLRNLGANDVEGFQKYIDAGKLRTQTSMAPSAVNIAANQADAAAKKIQSMLSDAGTEVGKANKAGEEIKLDPTKVEPLATTLNNRLESSFGLKVAHDPDTEALTLVPTRRGGVTLSPTEQQRVLDVASRINNLGDGGTVREADDLMTTLDRKVDYGMGGTDPLQGVFKGVRGLANKVARDASPEFAEANDKATMLHGLLDETQAMAGKDTSRGELLMRRVFTGDKGQDVQDLFSKIKNVTGIDLNKEALFAKYATDIFGNTDDKTLLDKMISNVADAHTGGIFSSALNMAGNAAKKTFANPQEIGKRLIQGGESLGPLTKYAAHLASREAPRAVNAVKRLATGATGK